VGGGGVDRGDGGVTGASLGLRSSVCGALVVGQCAGRSCGSGACWVARRDAGRQAAPRWWFAARESSGVGVAGWARLDCRRPGVPWAMTSVHCVCPTAGHRGGTAVGVRRGAEGGVTAGRRGTLGVNSGVTPLLTPGVAVRAGVARVRNASCTLLHLCGGFRCTSRPATMRFAHAQALIEWRATSHEPTHTHLARAGRGGSACAEITTNGPTAAHTTQPDLPHHRPGASDDQARVQVGGAPVRRLHCP
jgi:hypothetical protein